MTKIRQFVFYQIEKETLWLAATSLLDFLALKKPHFPVGAAFD